jgi:sarcosine oxidase subunit beta
MSFTVVGAGVSGLSIAFHLRERGLGPVTVVDRVGIGTGASGVQPGGVRQQWSTRASCLMARESHAFYGSLAERLGVAVHARFDPCGYLFVADTHQTLAELAANVAVQREAGVPSRLVTPAEATELVPSLRADGFLGAAHCGEDGYFDRPQAVVAAFAAAAVAGGARIEVAEATGITRDGAGWRLETRRGDMSSDCVIVAAAGGSVPLLAPLGFELPVVDEARHLFRSDPLAGRLLDPLVIGVDRGIAAKQLADGRLLASDLRATGDPAAGQDRWRTRIAKELASLIPGLDVSLPNMASGVYDLTPDAQPVVDELEPGLWVAAGFSGHGFMIAPSTGRLVAGTLAGDEPPEWREAVRWERFARRGSERESQVI